MSLKRTSNITPKEVEHVMDHINLTEIMGGTKKLKIELDPANQKAAEVLVTEGNAAFIKHVFNPTGQQELSYAEMRNLYG
jgi:hypothetical protein